MEKQAGYKIDVGAEETLRLMEEVGVPTVVQKTIEFEKLGAAAATWISMAISLQPGKAAQQVTVCIVRLMSDHPLATYSGHALNAPGETAGPRLGQRIALIRAVQAMLPDQPKQAGHIARRALWESHYQPAQEMHYGLDEEIEARLRMITGQGAS